MPAGMPTARRRVPASVPGRPATLVRLARNARSARLGAVAVLLAAAIVRPTVARAEPEVVRVIDRAVVRWEPDAPERVGADGFVVRHRGQSIARSVDLPPAPADPAAERRIRVRVEVEPVQSEIEGRLRPHDLWNRMGSVTVEAADPRTPEAPPVEVEVIRFVTGYGAAGVFEQDVTSLAPLLHGRRTIRGLISTYSEQPGWRLSVSFLYDAEGAGQRRPLLARPVFADPHLTAAANRVAATVIVPAGTATPRLRVLTTGHATDGRGANEFVSASHVLRIDGLEVARWRPWTEAGGPLRDRNPFSGRWEVDGRTIWSSDLDRSGWHPGLPVEPTLIPLPELTPGRHRIELEILGIRPAEPAEGEGPGPHGYWALSAVLIADAAWPE